MRGSIRRRWRGRWTPQPSLDKCAGAAVAETLDPRLEQGDDGRQLLGIVAPASDPLGIEPARELRPARRQHVAAGHLRREVAKLLGPFEADRIADPPRLAVEIG